MSTHTENPFKLHHPMIIAGPCSVESREQLLITARALSQDCRVAMLRAGVWKPRTRPGGFEGVGNAALEWLVEAEHETGLAPVIEVAMPTHVDAALKSGITHFWIGARTTGNPFSVQSIADALRGTGAAVLLKNPMNPDVNLWEGAAERLVKSGITSLGLIHRGFSSYGHSELRNPPMWHLAIEMRQRVPELPIFCDPSHICGNRTRLLEVAQMAADMDYAGLIVESHIAPDRALSDARQQITPERLSRLLDAVRWRTSESDARDYQTSIEILRDEIDCIDSELLQLLGRRMQISRQIGRVKARNNVTILQSRRWREMMQSYLAQCQRLELRPDFVNRLLETIHLESIERQKEILNAEEEKNSSQL